MLEHIYSRDMLKERHMVQKYSQNPIENACIYYIKIRVLAIDGDRYD